MSRLLRRMPLKSHQLLCTSVFIMLTAYVRIWFQPLPTSTLGWAMWSLFIGSQLLLGALLAWLLYHLWRRPAEPAAQLPHENQLPA